VRLKHIAVLLLLILFGYLLFWPVTVQPVAWIPPPAPAYAGPYAPNDALARASFGA